MEILRFTRTGRYLPDTHQYTHGQRTSQEASKSGRKPKSTQLATGLLRTLQPPARPAAAVGCRAEPHIRMSVQLTASAISRRSARPMRQPGLWPFRVTRVAQQGQAPATPGPAPPGAAPARRCTRAARQEGGRSAPNTTGHACRCPRAGPWTGRSAGPRVSRHRAGASLTRPDLTAKHPQPGPRPGGHAAD
jgi:hypothetical protein